MFGVEKFNLIYIVLVDLKVYSFKYSWETIIPPLSFLQKQTFKPLEEYHFACKSEHPAFGKPTKTLTNRPTNQPTKQPNNQSTTINSTQESPTEEGKDQDKESPTEEGKDKDKDLESRQPQDR